MSLEGLRRALADENVKNDLFRLLESESFDPAALHGLYPALHQQWKDIANAMQVPWQYIMVMDLSLAAAMAPTAVLPYLLCPLCRSTPSCGGFCCTQEQPTLPQLSASLPTSWICWKGK